MSMLHEPSRPDEPNFESASFDSRSHSVRDFGQSLRALVGEALRIGSLSPEAAAKLGVQSAPAPDLHSTIGEADALVMAERAARRALEAGTISARRASELVASADAEMVRKVELRTDRHHLSTQVAQFGLACGMLDEDSAKDLLETPGLRERAALAGQLLAGMAELQARWERTIDSLSSSGKISPDDASLLSQTASFVERREILDRLGNAAEERDKLDRAVSAGIITRERATEISETADQRSKTDAMDKLDLELETIELRQAMANSVERTLERALTRKIIGEDRATELRAIDDVERRFKEVKYLHVLADLDEEMERAFENLGPVDFDAPPFDLLEFKKGKKGDRDRD